MRSLKNRSLLSVNEDFEGEPLCCQKGLDTTLGEFLGDGLYLAYCPLTR